MVVLRDPRLLASAWAHCRPRFFLGYETRLPFDFDEGIGLVAPRPAIIVGPQHDRYAPIEDVRPELGGWRKICRVPGREQALFLDTPLVFNRFSRSTHERIFDRLAAQASAGPSREHR